MSTKLYRIVAALTALTLIFSVFSGARAAAPAASPPQFVFQNNVLSITSNMLELRIENGAINYIKHTASGEVLVNGSSVQNRPAVTQGFIGFTSKDTSGYYLRWPTPSSSVDFSLLQPNAGRLTYSNLYFNGSVAENSTLIYDITVDTTGEIIIQVTGAEGTAGLLPFSLDLPIMNSATQSVILGSGAEYFRTEAAKEDQVSFPGFGLYSPTMAVIQGNQSVVGLWSESTRYAHDNIHLIHKPTYDHLVLHAEQDMSASNKQQIVSPAWRIGTYPAWYEAARRWKSAFEARTGAKPLWQNATPWVRNIHTFFEAANNNFSEQPQKFAELASVTDPQKTLYYEWNGDRIVLFGDHTLVKNGNRPTAEEMQYVRQYGWPMILYHPYTLIFNEQAAARRLAMLRGMDWLPEGYQFNPDYNGTPANWQSYWADVRGTYDSDLHLLHPASNKFQSYLLQNLPNYLNRYGAVGAYMDTLGMDAGSWFPEEKQVFNGDSFVLGEMKAIAQTRAATPGLAIMSEYSAPWLLPYIFFTYEGTETFLRQNQYANTRLNHPLKVALTGSYRWAKEDNTVAIDDNVSALLGTLPQVSLVGDWDVSKDRALWSQARARLFTESELFNDIPAVWQDGVLAYYRSNNGNWFAYKKIGAGYGYVEILPDGSEVIRLSKDNLPPPTTTPAPTPSPSPTPTATSIPNEPYGYTQVTPQVIDVNGIAQVEVGLGSLPAEGFAGVEFACSYDANIIEVSNIAVTDLFGADPVAAIQGPQNGSLIIAVAGSQENRATANGAVAFFDARALQLGKTSIECKTRVIDDEDQLIPLPSNSAYLVVSIGTPLPTIEPSSTPQPFPSPTPEPLPSPTLEPPTTGTLTGRVQSSKPVTIELYNADNTLVMSQDANSEGVFALDVPPGTYTVLIISTGFLRVQGSITLAVGQTIELPLIVLLAGDLDGNNVIDQFDALTIGMNYNGDSPAAADLNSDGVINLIDLRLLARNYRKSGPLTW